MPLGTSVGAALALASRSTARFSMPVLDHRLRAGRRALGRGRRAALELELLRADVRPSDRRARGHRGTSRGDAFAVKRHTRG